MIYPPVFRKTVFISLIGHIAVFSIFSLSFGNRIPVADYARVSSFGQVLLSSQVKTPLCESKPKAVRNFPLKKPDITALSKTMNDSPLGPRFYTPRPENHTLKGMDDAWPLGHSAQGTPDFSLGGLHFKPQLTAALYNEKPAFMENIPNALFPAGRKDPTLIFHPLLPYSFLLYFKDRQVAHVELMFNIVSDGGRHSTVIKRKISSQK